MANWDILKNAVSNVIKANDNKEITGIILQQTLLSIINNVGANATFAGIAEPSTNPGTPDGPVFWLATEVGTYVNFNRLTVSDEVAILLWSNNSWSKYNTGIITITAVADKIERVELECDDTKIVLKGTTTALTYAQIKALVDDSKKFVTLHYLDMWWMLPAYDDGGAIMFTATDIEGGQPVTTRVIINTEGKLNNYSIIGEDADHKTDDLSKETAQDGHATYPTTHAVNQKNLEQDEKLSELAFNKVDIITGNNIVNPNSLTFGKYFANYKETDYTGSALRCVTPLIEVNDNISFNYPSNVGQSVLVYGEDKNIIREHCVEANESHYVFQEGDKYIRIAFILPNSNSIAFACLGDTLLDVEEYTQYKPLKDEEQRAKAAEKDLKESIDDISVDFIHEQSEDSEERIDFATNDEEVIASVYFGREKIQDMLGESSVVLTDDDEKNPTFAFVDGIPYKIEKKNICDNLVKPSMGMSQTTARGLFSMIPHGAIVTNFSFYPKSASGSDVCTVWELSDDNKKLVKTREFVVQSVGANVQHITELEKKYDKDSFIMFHNESGTGAIGMVRNGIGNDCSITLSSIVNNELDLVANNIIGGNIDKLCLKVEYMYLCEVGHSLLTVGEGEYFENVTKACYAAVYGDTININAGEYESHIQAWGKKINLIGSGRASTILFDDGGDYSNPPIEMNVGCISNLSIKETMKNPTCSESDKTSGGYDRYKMAYCVHIESGTNNDGTGLVIENCYMYNENRPCIGCGLYENYGVKLINSTLHSGMGYVNKVSGGNGLRGALYFHSNTNVTPLEGQYFYTKDSVIECDDTIAATITTFNSNKINITMINNVFWSGVNKKGDNIISHNTEFGVDAIINEISTGNNINIFNK